MKTNFNGMYGNTTTITLLKRLLRFGNFKPVTIFHGPRGTGKSVCAQICAQTLTCEQPGEDGPCGKCQACLLNAEALATGSQSPYVKVVNMGRINTSDDVNGLIREVFEFQSASRRQVYVFEEIHALKYVKNGFVSLLSEIDHMDGNTYIVATTSALYDVKEDLVSRSLLFEFRQLKHSESLLFAEYLLKERQKSIDKEILKVIISYCKGIPREIEKLVDFVAENEVSVEEIKDFLQVVSVSAVVNMFTMLKQENFAAALEILRDLEESVSVSQIIRVMKDFIVSAVFLLEMGSSQEFSSDEKVAVRNIFPDSKTVTKVVACLERLGSQSSEADLTLALLKIRMILCGKSEASIVASVRSMAAQERVEAESMRSSLSAGVSSFKGLKKLTSSSLSAFGEGDR